jgi:hypothetical protein
MALIVSVPLQGNFVAAGCYVRIRVVDVVKKDRRDDTFYACGDLAVYKDAAEAAKVDDDGMSKGDTLVSPQLDRVKATGVNLDNNIHQQLYAKLKTDLTDANITWAEE